MFRRRQNDHCQCPTSSHLRRIDQRVRAGSVADRLLRTLTRSDILIGALRTEILREARYWDGRTVGQDRHSLVREVCLFRVGRLEVGDHLWHWTGWRVHDAVKQQVSRVDAL